MANEKSKLTKKLVKSHEPFLCRGVQQDGVTSVFSGAEQPLVIVNVFDTGETDVICPYYEVDKDDCYRKCTAVHGEGGIIKIGKGFHEDPTRFGNCRYSR